MSGIIYIYIYIYVCVYVYVYVHTYTHTQTYTHTVYIHTHIHIHIKDQYETKLQNVTFYYWVIQHIYVLPAKKVNRKAKLELAKKHEGEPEDEPLSE